MTATGGTVILRTIPLFRGSLAFGEKDADDKEVIRIAA